MIIDEYLNFSRKLYICIFYIGITKILKYHGSTYAILLMYHFNIFVWTK